MAKEKKLSIKQFIKVDNSVNAPRGSRNMSKVYNRVTYNRKTTQILSYSFPQRFNHKPDFDIKLKEIEKKDTDLILGLFEYYKAQNNGEFNVNQLNVRGNPKTHTLISTLWEVCSLRYFDIIKERLDELRLTYCKELFERHGSSLHKNETPFFNQIMEELRPDLLKDLMKKTLLERLVNQSDDEIVVTIILDFILNESKLIKLSKLLSTDRDKTEEWVEAIINV